MGLALNRPRLSRRAVGSSGGRRGIRIEISDRYLGGPDPDRANKPVSEVLANLFHESIRQTDLPTRGPMGCVHRGGPDCRGLALTAPTGSSPPPDRGHMSRSECGAYKQLARLASVTVGNVSSGLSMEDQHIRSGDAAWVLVIKRPRLAMHPSEP